MTAFPSHTGSFVFVAAKTGGGRKLGLRSAASERALADSLRRERLLLLRSYRLPAWAGGTTRGLSLRARSDLNDQLAQLLSRGVPLVEALEVTAQTVDSSARPQVEKMRELVAAGSSFADACQKTGAFDRVNVAVYRAAERTGDLAGAAKQLAKTARRQLAVSGKAKTLMVYPAIVASISILVLAVLLIVVVPMIGRSITSMGVELPWYSRAVFGLGALLQGNLAVVVVAFAVVVVALLVLRKSVLRGLGHVVRRLPMARDMLLAQESARFFSVMAAMTRSGVPLADALGVASEAINLPVLRRQLSSLRTRLIEGGVLRNLIESVDALPLATRRLLIAAERSGDLENAFEGLAEDTADEVDRRATRLLAALEPLLIVALFAVIGSVVLAIMLPLLSMASKVM